MPIDEQALRKLIGFIPNPNHEKIMDCKAREIVLVAGRGFGKSFLAAYRAFRKFLEDGQKIAVVAPSYGLADKVFENLFRFRALGFKNLKVQNKPFKRLWADSWGSEIVAKSAEAPQEILGERYDLVVVDEAAQIPRNIFQQYIYPTTSAGGEMFYISTPFGKGSWFYDRWLIAKELGGAFNYTSVDGPIIRREEWERAKRELPEHVFQQEYEAHFLDDAARAFRGIRECVKDNCLEDSRAGEYYIMGVDLAKHRDFTVLTVVRRGVNKVVFWDRFKEVDYPLQKTRIISVAKRYNNARLVVDSTGVGEPIADDLKREGLIVDDFRFSKQSRIDLLEKLGIFIEQKQIFYPNNETLLDELESLRIEMKETGRHYSVPEGRNDDCIMSLALAVWGLSGPPVKDSISEEIKKNPFARNPKRKMIGFQYI